jgi:hypothetical protein
MARRLGVREAVWEWLSAPVPMWVFILGFVLLGLFVVGLGNGQSDIAERVLALEGRIADNEEDEDDESEPPWP